MKVDRQISMFFRAASDAIHVGEAQLEESTSRDPYFMNVKLRNRRVGGIISGGAFWILPIPSLVILICLPS